MAVVTLNTIDRILAKARFQMRAALGLQLVLLGLAVAAGSLSPIGIQIGQTDAGPFLVMAAGLAWLLMVMRSLKQGQLMRQASQLIGQRRGAQAVPFLAETLLRFSVFRLTKLIAMHHLMEMAYGQKDWPAAARLAGEILGYDLARRKGLSRRACLVLADSYMELGYADVAGEALSHLHGQKLTLAERLHLLPILLRWQMMSGKYSQAVDNLEEKVQLAGLLPCEKACLVHVLLAAAAGHCGLRDVSRFLLRRAELHHDLKALAQDNPSAASYLVQMQAREPERLVAAAGRKAHGHTAGPAVSQDVQQEDPSEPSGDHNRPSDSDCNICARS